jgi:hypothetical protein
MSHKENGSPPVGEKRAGDTLKRASRETVVLEVNAAYNRDGLAMPRPNGPNGRRVLNLEMLLNHPLYWDFLNERETEEVLMELYIARTRRMQ